MSYASTVLADGPVAYYRLGEASGTTMADSSGNAHPGTFSATGITYGAVGALTADADTALTFDGATGKAPVTTGLLGTFAASPSSFGYSIEAWLKFTVSSSELFAVSLGNSGTSNSIFGIACVSPSSGTVTPSAVTGGIMTFIRDSTAATLLKLGSTSAYNDGAWHHVVVTVSRSDTAAGANGTARLYVDGAQSSSAQLPSSAAITFDKTSIGFLGRATDNSWWNGSIDEVAFYAAALSSSRVSAHYNAGLAIASAGGAPKIHTGSAFAVKPLKRHDGSAWAAKPIERLIAGVWTPVP